MVVPPPVSPGLVGLATRCSALLNARLRSAGGNFFARAARAWADHAHAFAAVASRPLNTPADLAGGFVDACQRAVLFADTLRQRGNGYIEHELAGKPPVLHFGHEIILDARRFDRPANYALARIVWREGPEPDPKRRPYIIIDPRAGHGPGIGGFKADSQVGVALKDGHPVYFVLFFPEPEAGQTMLDVCAAEQRFVREVRRRHPDSPRPAIVGNCQGGWAAMMLAAASPEDTGPILINGAPLSYWGGAWTDGEGDNPMRYAAGLLGGSWLASLSADLGAGRFDGAHLVANFENLNPANTFWDKYFNLYDRIDTEPPRFLEFERWWGGFYLLNRQEIEWITQNLFVGNKLSAGELHAGPGRVFDLREIRSPIVLFASMGDNITPPQQALNWLGDVYRSNDEIKSCGQTIVALLHEDVGHLGIFVSGRVAKKEHTQLVSVLKSIEALPPGLYGMKILRRTGPDGRETHDVEFVERRLEEVVRRLNRFDRRDERPFEAVEAVSEFNQRAYELFARPWLAPLASEPAARLARAVHPLRVQRWAWSDLNPLAHAVGAAAAVARERRSAVPETAPWRQAERLAAELASTWLDFGRAVRDAVGEAAFFGVYGALGTLILPRPGMNETPPVAGRDLPFVREALDSMEEGGYPEAVARCVVLLSPAGAAMPLSALRLRQELLGDYRDLLPDLPVEQARRIRGEQEIIVRYEREEAIRTLPLLLSRARDRRRLIDLFDRLVADPRVPTLGAGPAQAALWGQIRKDLFDTMPSNGSRPRENHELVHQRYL